jgi:hypothetical protein
VDPAAAVHRALVEELREGGAHVQLGVAEGRFEACQALGLALVLALLSARVVDS